MMLEGAEGLNDLRRSTLLEPESCHYCHNQQHNRIVVYTRGVFEHHILSM